ncbi:hypothetical protein QBC34DRAFT_13902 [Podospora aff. communis PSN243]|uniref:LPXTG-motif cell wall anchor domain protein n=1 Tax=Podospora aff. communis PSN243 TaxID=3040156 RepID=A0AAV9HB10_9PEZI|nr:hypothetical protein QBC34DRAFT_13902 [Podospora aff. communis PSN243]
MATTFAVGVDSGHGPHPTAASFSTAAQQQAHLGTHQHNNSAASTTASNASNNSFSSNNSIFDAHRQNHNSSKLPAFRFADLKKDAVLPSLPSLLQHIPPSPVSPQTNTTIDGSADGQQQQPQPQQRDAHDQPAPSQEVAGLLPDGLVNIQTPPEKSPTPETAPSKSLPPHQASPPRTRASTFQTTAVSTTTNDKSELSIGSKRPASFPDSPSIPSSTYPHKTQSSSTVTPAAKRRLTASGLTNTAETVASHSNSTATTNDDPSSTKEWAQGQRELLLPKTAEFAKSDDRRKSRPPVSYRPPNATGGRAVIPPIRSFRSSGSRKSLVLDMHVRRVSDDSYGEDVGDTNQRDRTLRALEGRQEDDFSQITPPDSADAIGDSENTADLFMRIAREDSNQAPEEPERPAEQSAISRITRGAHRRPLSAAVPTYQATSPPQITRRLSDQRENTRARQLADSQSPQQMPRDLSYRSSVREKPMSNGTTIVETTTRSQIARTPLRPSPITPRQISFQDPAPDTGSPYRRRQSVTEGNAGATVSRTSQYRNANLALGVQGRTYNSSPLVPRSTGFPKDELQPSIESSHGVEGTESSTSTTAPSTMWDELDDLKSRIHRLELTGKAPSTSGAAMSRASDDRPPTATTNATTMSASPKRGSGPGASQPDASSTTSSQREAQPILLSALSKTKGIVSNEVFSAIEAAATDALALTTMVGAPGQLGPISSGASTIGGVGNVTDRQLRRKADSICRSLTELCIALADESGPTKPPQSAPAPREREIEPLTSPTVTKFAPLPAQRRPSTLVDSTPSKPAVMSPRAPTSLEQRRLTMLASTTLPSPRYALAPLTPMESAGAGRKTSLLLSRTRRAGTEEPEEMTGRRSSLLLRTRRAGTEEPEENRDAPQGRKTSLLVRSRKLSNDDEEEPRFRVPSRAITEVNSFRTTPRDANPQSQASPPDPNPLGSSALPRRRLVPSSLNPRLVAPATPLSASTRRYLDRPTPDRETNSVAEKLAEDRGQRPFSLSQTAVLNRTGSISTRRTRESTIPQNGQAGGSYR